MPASAADQLHRPLGSPVVNARRVHGGYTPAARWIVTLSDGGSAFVKQAVHESVVGRLRREHRTYSHLSGPWLPDVLGFEDGARPMLVLEDLSACEWPPPWSTAKVDAVRATLAALETQPVPPGLRSATGMAEGGWPEVARDPKPFLGLGLCSAPWLEHALPTLLEAADPALLDGRALCHLDVRSDNLCFRPDGQAVLIDWDCAAVGNPEFDFAFWLPSLNLEGGPAPQDLGAVTPGVVALVAGFFASVAGLAAIPHAPAVRDIQLRQLEIALPWAADVLGLDPPDKRP
ncbi:MAG TPA: phosphotransferase [Solirubrobacteraceae bacterium]|nr:phosphotransferase [Solirubrobacteraceae bacterium]